MKSRRVRRSATLMSLMLTVSVLMAACGSDDKSTSVDDSGPVTTTATTSGAEPPSTATDQTAAATTGGGATDTTGATEGTTGATTAPEANADPDATFRWATSTDTPSMDPHRVSATFYSQFLLPVYDRLLFMNSDTTVSPMLATEWEIVADPPSIELTLRDDVTFHSGAPFDAEVVKANLERAKNLPESLMKNDLAPLDAVEVIDPTHVRLLLNRPAPGLLASLSDRAGMMIDPGAFDSPDLLTNGAGSGPWKIAERTVDSKTVYEKVEGYWDPAAQQVGALEILVILDDDSRLNAVVTGQAEAMELRPSQIERAEADLEISSEPVARSYNVLINNGKDELADPRVRVALQYAIDRQAIAEEILAGGCEASVQAAPEGYVTHAEDVGPDYFPYDPDRARELLAEAGVDSLSLKALSANQPIYVQIAEAVQAMLAEAGIEMSVEPIPSAQINEIFNQRQEGDLMFQQTAPTPDPSAGARNAWLVDSFGNPGKQTTEEITALVDKVSTTPAGPELDEAWDQLTKATRDFGMDIIICNQVQIFGQAPGVQGLRQNLLGSYFDFRTVSIAKK